MPSTHSLVNDSPQQAYGGNLRILAEETETQRVAHTPAPTAGTAPTQAPTPPAGSALLPLFLSSHCLFHTQGFLFCIYTKELQIHLCLVHDHLNLRGFKSRTCSSELVKNYCCFSVLGIKSRALRMLGKCSDTEWHP